MNWYKIHHNGILKAVSIRNLLIVILLSLSANGALAQEKFEDEPAICKINANGKEYITKANDEGYFDLISGLIPMVLIPVEVAYPNGKVGEKVVLTAVNDGSFDNKKQVKVMTLDSHNKCIFSFQLTDHPGLFEIVLRKGSDTKVVQLWVGKE